jgi:hypothetical protein
MRQKQAAAMLIALCCILVISCSKKHVPQSSAEPLGNAAVPAVKKVPVKKAAAVPVAKVIMVNDSVAKKNIDGRLYYDVGGHRYWRNYDDGKYYLFNKSMYTNKAFKPH